MSPLMETITNAFDSTIADLFGSICEIRNRIIHIFQITDTDGEQRLATKDKANKQYVITEKILLNFIQENEQLSHKLYCLRG